MNGYGDGTTALNRLMDGDGEPSALLVAGPPCCGKTRFAYQALLQGLQRFGNANATMTVSGRVAADELGNRVIRRIGASSQVRPVTTLSALAFGIINNVRIATDEPAPRLLNGAEQDALLRRVVAVHLLHAQSGDLCDTCLLLQRYFASDDWASTVTAGSATMSSESATALSLFERGVSTAFIDQLRDMLARINELGASFSMEEDLIAALRTSGAGMEWLELQWRLAFALRREYVSAIERAYPGEYRLDASRLLVEAESVLVGQHAEAERPRTGLPALLIVDDFQDTTLAGLRFLEALAVSGVRLLLVGNPDEAVQTFRGSYPEYLFSRACHGALHADLLRLDTDGRCQGSAVGQGERNERQSDHAGRHTYRDVVAARVSLSIPSEEQEALPLVNRPWKLPRYAGSLPIAKLPESSPLVQDGTVITNLYHSSGEELDDVAWRIKRMHLDHQVSWNDMAVIAHDNTTVRQYGERLRRDGVPVRYSSVNRPLKDEPFVQGLFALTELAALRRQGAAGTEMPLASVASYVRSRVATLMGCPLITTGSKPGEGHAARLEPIESAMRALESLSEVITHERTRTMSPVSNTENVATDNAETTSASRRSGTGVRHDANGALPSGHTGATPELESTGTPVAGSPIAAHTGDRAGVGSDVETGDTPQTSDAGSRLSHLVDAWHTLRQAVGQAHAQNAGDGGENADGPVAQVDDHLVDADKAIGDEVPFGVDALYIMLAFDDPMAPAQQVLDAISAVLGHDPHAKAFGRLWGLVRRVADGVGRLDADTPQQVLGLAWQTAAVDKVWQRMALLNTPEGRAANDRLDAAMRLFQSAEGFGQGRSTAAFIEQVRSMQIEADSLAHVGPVEQAVTLTTPAGAAGRHWRQVWLPAVQQDVWPNLAERGTMFGGEDLADMMLRGTLPDHETPTAHDRRLTSVLSSEKKSLLVALTRAEETVSISATWSDDATPSDFLFGYVPERFDRNREHNRFTSAGASMRPHGSDRMSEIGTDSTADYGGLDADPRGLITAARVALARHTPQSPQGRDAAAALALLAEHGMSSADPDNWSFITEPCTSESTENEFTDNSASEVESTGAVRLSTLAAAATTETETDASAAAATAMDESEVHGLAAARPSPTAPMESESLHESSATGGNQVRQGYANDSVSVRKVAHVAPSSDDHAAAPVVTLSPSSVDNIWACPVCWMLENRFSGPRADTTATSFGTLIHEVARLGSEEGLDMPSFMPDATETARLEAVTHRLRELYTQLRPNPSTIADTRQRYNAMRKDQSADEVLANIAGYFVKGGDDGYLRGNAKNFSIGTLERVECEREFAARFSLEDILQTYCAIPGVEPIELNELACMMGALVGGWPEGMRNDLVVRLSGRIDRLEHRRSTDGMETIRLIDYKTGQQRTAEYMANDLQLVCYQLGLAFPDNGHHDRRQPSDARITQSELFYVGHYAAPAFSHAPESAFQPPLFINGSLNDESFVVRSYYKDAASVLDVPDLPPDAPVGVRAETWERLLKLRGTQAVWALTMIARVFYAAAASRSQTLTAHPTSVHLEHCGMKQVCPACAGQVDTVFETRQA